MPHRDLMSTVLPEGRIFIDRCLRIRGFKQVSKRYVRAFAREDPSYGVQS